MGTGLLCHFVRQPLDGSIHTMPSRVMFIALLLIACTTPASTDSPPIATSEPAKHAKPSLESSSIESLPQRAAPAPVTPTDVPHLQQTDNSPPAVYAALAEYLFSLEHVEERSSTQSIASSRAAWISDAIAVQKGMNREFTHLHTEPGPGSQHMAVPKALATEVLSKGWGIAHPYNGKMYPHLSLIMIYAPRDEAELVVVKQIVAAAHQAVVKTP